MREHSDSPGPALRNPLEWLRWVPALTVALLLLLLLLLCGSVVFLPMLCAIALAYLLAPYVKWFEQRGWSRSNAALLGLTLATLLFALALIFILPGIPQIFEAKFHAIRDRFAATPYTLRVVYSRQHEGQIAQHLNATVAAYPELLLGSYPKIGDPEYAVKLTLESKDPDYVERALAHLLELLPAAAVVKTE